jgi:hypothetical protein
VEEYKISTECTSVSDTELIFCGCSLIYSQMEANLETLPDSLPEKTNPFLTLREQREKGIPIWLNLAEAVSKARIKLHGDDLELFERLVSTSRTPTEAEDLIQKWREGELGTFGKLRDEAFKPFNWKELSRRRNIAEKESCQCCVEGLRKC